MTPARHARRAHRQVRRIEEAHHSGPLDDPRGAAGGGRSGYVCPVAQSHPAASGPTPPGSSSGISAASARPAATASGDAAPVAVTAETGAPGTGDQRAGAAEDSPAATARAAD